MIPDQHRITVLNAAPDRGAVLLALGLASVTLWACAILLWNRPPLPPINSAWSAGVGAYGAADRAPTPVTDWNSVMSGGHRLGPDDAPVTIVEFSDFQCADCRIFETVVVPALRRQFPNQIAFVFRHYPSAQHHDAYSAARAAECAAREGRFSEFRAALFSRQSAIGHTPLAVFARESGVTDVRAFNRCLSDSTTLSAVEADVAEARRIGAVDVPTVVVNGVRYPGVPDARLLGPVIRAAIEQARAR